MGLRKVKNKQQKEFMLEAIYQHGGNLKEIAEQYNIPLRTITDWITRYNLENDVLDARGQELKRKGG